MMMGFKRFLELYFGLFLVASASAINGSTVPSPADDTYEAVSSSVLVDDRLQPRCDKTWDQYASSEYCASFPDARRVYFHAIFDLLRPSSLPLLAHQVCRAMAHCIAPQNFRVILHAADAIVNDLSVAKKFLFDFGITPFLWRSVFLSSTSSYARLHALEGINASDSLILQSDIDEFPDFSHLKVMVSSLLAPDAPCDVFTGVLHERLARSGDLINITLGTPLGATFPLRCDIKKSMQKDRMKKIVMYRASFRPDMGNHRMRCQRAFSVEECNRKASRYSHMYPRMTHLPRQCESRTLPVLVGDSSKSLLFRSHSVGQKSSFGDADINQKPLYALPIDHYKFVWGLESYLSRRVKNSRALNVSWYREFQQLLHYLDHQDGSVCLDCGDVHCEEAPEVNY
jgi:hypothetical protein